MNEINEEIKIAEKVKFWEEQEQINNLIVERLVDLRKETAIQAVEAEVIKNEYIKYKSENEKNLHRITDIENLNQVLSNQIEDQNKKINDLIERPRLKSKKEERLAISAITLSLVSILISILSIAIF
ncbi:hypothetical protein [Exiguobacterium sp. RIT594]|uniref:hypothetical protein n=1 Tax=Exiguobacterium sp. RIT594 TaxID=2282449 RepID=UPI000DF78801|nr:hypothetical protein [Exiguobacterium sp. RIT594]RDB33313.1 hypothetical protein DVG79_01235 [Exiguobacterium sp. RIT594]